jgi:hypothetical protein
MALLDVIQRFANEFKQEEKNFGTLTLQAEQKEVQEELLPDGELKTFYASLDFDKLTVGTTLFLDIATLAELPKYQEGWRWEYDADPAGQEDTEDWDSTWLVFGDKHGDAVFAKLEEEVAPIFGSIQKAEEYQLASSLESFLSILSDCMIMEREEFGNETKLEDFTVKPEFIDRIRSIVAKYEGEDIAGKFADFFFG